MEKEKTPEAENDAAAGGSLCLLSLNLGLLGFELRSRWHIALASGNDERAMAAPPILSSVDADIIALQEVYGSANRRLLLQALSQSHPHHVEPPRSYSLVDNGLLLLSRFPILQSAFTPCRGAPRWTSPLWKQGFLAAEIDMPVFGRSWLINVHIAASLPFGNPNAAVSEENRTREIAQLLSAASAVDPAAILIGDFNTSEEIYPANYRRLIAAGYVDAFIAANGSARHPPAFTWDAANPINAGGRFRDFPSQRIDHVFIHNARMASFTSIAARVVFQERSVRMKAGYSACLSDHYGMLVTLTR